MSDNAIANLVKRLRVVAAARREITKSIALRRHIIEDDAADELERLARENLELQAKLEEARKDAERYRWLRHALSDRSRNGRSHHFCSIAEGRPEELDAAIDDAMSQEKRMEALDRMARDADELGLDY